MTKPILQRIFGYLLALVLVVAPMAHAVASIDRHAATNTASVIARPISADPPWGHQEHRQGAPKNDGDSANLATLGNCCLGCSSCGAALNTSVARLLSQLDTNCGGVSTRQIHLATA